MSSNQNPPRDGVTLPEVANSVGDAVRHVSANGKFYLTAALAALTGVTIIDEINDISNKEINEGFINKITDYLKLAMTTAFAGFVFVKPFREFMCHNLDRATLAAVEPAPQKQSGVVI